MSVGEMSVGQMSGYLGPHIIRMGGGGGGGGGGVSRSVRTKNHATHRILIFKQISSAVRAPSSPLPTRR